MRIISALIALLGLGALNACLAQTPVSFRYFYYDSGELYRVLDSTGTLIEYTIDPSRNITNVVRSTLPSTQLSILNVVPANAIGGSTILLLGQNFSSVATGDLVTIGGIAATVVSASPTQLVVLAPGGTSGGNISVTVAGVTATWSNGVAVDPTPAIISISQASGGAGSTISVTATGQDLSGAVFTLQSVDPLDTAAGGSVTVASNTGTTATLTVVLGATQGQFALVATNSNGASTVTPAVLFLIGPVSNSVSSYASILNAGYNPITYPPYPPGQNSLASYASVLNSGLNTITYPPYPPGQNLLASYTSVLNTGLNTIAYPPYPPGQNDLSSYASVLNTSFGSTSGITVVASLGLSVCNTNSGCTAKAPAIISANAAPLASTRPIAAPPLASPGDPPELEPLDERTKVTVGQTLRLAARNVDSGSTVEFEVNQTVIATVSESPYETLFTVPYGPDELVFQVGVHGVGQPERLSRAIRIAIDPDSGANISGTISQGIGGLELSLAAGGLRAEYFHLPQPVTGLPSLDGLQPVRTGYVTAINEPNPRSIFGDDPLGAHLSPDYAIRFSGAVRADETGHYRFWLTARSGAAILIDGKLLADSGFVSGEPAEASVTVKLDTGWHALEVIYYLAVGASSVRLEWQQPGGRREVVGPEFLRTALTGMTAVSDTDGTFVFRQIPRKLDSVWIRARDGNGFVEFPAVSPGATHVSISIPR